MSKLAHTNTRREFWQAILLLIVIVVVAVLLLLVGSSFRAATGKGEKIFSLMSSGEFGATC